MEDRSRARIRGRGAATRIVHAGERPERPEFTPVVTPIYPGSTYIYEDLEVLDTALAGAQGRYVYTRYGNPTTTALESVIADLEGTTSAVTFGSGMAAVHAAIMTSVERGAGIVAAPDVYGATYSMLSGFMRDWGCNVEMVDALDLDAVADAVKRVKPQLIVCEVISNPLLRVADIPALATIAKDAGAALMVDSTFSPLIYQPAKDGAHLVVHSLTKYINGHGDVTGGAVATSAMRRERLANFAKMTGAILGPFESWLTIRGVKTLPLRFERQCRSAAIIANALAEHPLVSHVNFPGLKDHPSHATAAKLFGDKGFGGMISFDIKDAGKEQAWAFLEALQLIAPATSLGDVYSLALSPAMSSHRALPPEARAEIGIGEGLIRISVGIEEPEDILSDLDQALQAANRAR